MPFLIAICAAMLWRAAYNLKKSARPDGYAMMFAEGVINYVRIVFVVALIFCWVQGYLDDAGPNDLRSATIKTLEQSIITLRLFIAPFLKLSAISEVFVASLLVLVGASIPALAGLRLLNRYKIFSKWTARLSVALTLITSVTFFGKDTIGHAQALEAELNMQIDSTRTAYSTYVRDLEKVVIRVIVKQELSDLLNTHSFRTPLTSTVEEVQKAKVDDYFLALELRQAGEHIKLAKLPEGFPGETDHLVDIVRVKSSASPTEPSLNEEEVSASQAVIEPLASELQMNDSTKFDPDAKLIEIVEKMAVAAYESTSRPAVDSLLEFSGFDVRVDLIRSILQPFIYGPLKDLVKTTTRSLYAKTVLANVSLPVAIAEAKASLASALADYARSGQLEEVQKRLDSYERVVKEAKESSDATGAVLKAREKWLDHKVELEESASERGDWGKLRKRLRKALESGTINTSDSDTRERMNQAYGLWQRKARQEAVALLHRKEHYSTEGWERVFFAETQEHPELAALWGWVVKSANDSLIREKYNTNNPVPELGYRLYLEQTGLASGDITREVFNKEAAVTFITNVCEHLGN
jgi:hypothetical protein